MGVIGALYLLWRLKTKNNALATVTPRPPANPAMLLPVSIFGYSGPQAPPTGLSRAETISTSDLVHEPEQSRVGATKSLHPHPRPTLSAPLWPLEPPPAIRRKLQKLPVTPISVRTKSNLEELSSWELDQCLGKEELGSGGFGRVVKVRGPQ